MTMSLCWLVHDDLEFRVDTLHEGCDPELPVNQERDIPSTRCESANNSRHQIADDDKIADCHAEALDSDSGVEDDGQVRICHLGQCCKGYVSAINVSRASRLQVEAEACCCASPRDNEYAEEDAHFRKRGRHGEETGTENYPSWSTCFLGTGW